MHMPTFARLFCLLTLLPLFAAAQITDLRLPISLDADSTDYDGKNSMLLFRGLRISQGNVGIEADEGRATNLDFEDSVWQFKGNVIIDVEGGHIECDTADLSFTNHQLVLATIGGTPATYELTRPGSEEKTYGRAGRMRYDLTSGVIEFADDATVTEAGNKISSNFIVYDINQQRISAQGSADGEDRVKILFTPRESDAARLDELIEGSDAATSQVPATDGEGDP